MYPFREHMPVERGEDLAVFLMVHDDPLPEAGGLACSRYDPICESEDGGALALGNVHALMIRAAWPSPL